MSKADRTMRLACIPMTSLLHRLLLLLFILPTLFCYVSSRFSGAILLPHGDFAWDPTLLPHGDQRVAATKVARAARNATKSFFNNLNHKHQRKFGSSITKNNITNKTIILFVTPHGIALQDDFGVYIADSASGTAVLGQDLIPPTKSYTLRLDDVRVNRAMSLDLLANVSSNNNITSITTPPGVDIPLYWGEVIPLSMIQQQVQHNTSHQYQHVILSLPDKRYTTDMTDKAVQLGRDVGKFIRSIQDRDVVVVVSGDLAHTHCSDGPYGYSNTSIVFDRAVQSWAERSDPDALLKTARAVQATAKSCAYVGLCLLHGILTSSVDAWKGTVWANTNATYYGMMVATFESVAMSSNNI